MKASFFAASFLAFTSIAIAAQEQPMDPTQRAAAIATRRAERDSNRTQRLPSRPVTLRAPLPLPVTVDLPVGGAPAATSCPVAKSCRVAYSVPAGQLLVVTGLWSATEIRCDDTSLGATPPNGRPVAPWWHCSSSLAFAGGPGAGFVGYLFARPSGE